MCADALTSQLELLPFSRMCVNYKVGDALPDKIKVTNLDVKGVKTVVEVKVEYANKPLLCSGCKSLGHYVTACPTTKRFWVRKQEVKVPAGENTADCATGKSEDEGAKESAKVNGDSPPYNSPDAKEQDVVETNLPEKEQATSNLDKGEQWHEISKKYSFPSRTPTAQTHSDTTKNYDTGLQKGNYEDTTPGTRLLSPSTLSDGSPTPGNTFINLRHVDEMDINMVTPAARFNISPSKRRRKAKGKSPS